MKRRRHLREKDRPTDRQRHAESLSTWAAVVDSHISTLIYFRDLIHRVQSEQTTTSNNNKTCYGKIKVFTEQSKSGLPEFIWKLQRHRSYSSQSNVHECAQIGCGRGSFVQFLESTGTRL